MATPLNRSHAVVAVIAVAVGAIGGVLGASALGSKPETPPSAAVLEVPSLCPPPGAETPCPEPESTVSVTPAIATPDAGVRREVSSRPSAKKSLPNPYARHPLETRR
jgi:hypothetical protein